MYMQYREVIYGRFSCVICTVTGTAYLYMLTETRKIRFVKNARPCSKHLYIVRGLNHSAQSIEQGDLREATRPPSPVDGFLF